MPRLPFCLNCAVRKNKLNQAVIKFRVYSLQNIKLANKKIDHLLHFLTSRRLRDLRLQSKDQGSFARVIILFYFFILQLISLFIICLRLINNQRLTNIVYNVFCAPFLIYVSNFFFKSTSFKNNEWSIEKLIVFKLRFWVFTQIFWVFWVRILYIYSNI